MRCNICDSLYDWDVLGNRKLKLKKFYIRSINKMDLISLNQDNSEQR